MIKSENHSFLSKGKHVGITLLALSLFFFSIITGCEKKEQTAFQLIKKRGFLQIAVSGDDIPFGYVNSEGKNVGFEINFAKRLAKELFGDTSKIEFIIVDPVNRTSILQNDKADIVIANFTKTEERATVIDFAHPYMKVSIGVVSPKSAPIKNVEELNGKKIIVSKGTTSEDYFLKNCPDVEVLAFEQINEVFQALKDGRGNALAEDNGVVFIWAQENPNFEVSIGSLGSVDGIAPAVKKGNAELLAFINQTIEKLATEQFFHKNFETTLRPFMGIDANPDDFVVEGGKL
jgi:polar amino acid transport system substrate-binding protein